MSFRIDDKKLLKDKKILRRNKKQKLHGSSKEGVHFKLIFKDGVEFTSKNLSPCFTADIKFTVQRSSYMSYR